MKLNFAALFALLIFISSCSKKESTDKIFKYNEPNGIESLDPITVNNYPALHVLTNVCEGLLEYDKDANLQPVIARSYEISPDGKTYTFHLRSDVFFHDDECFPDKKGRRVIASDFKYCYERCCNPDTKTRGLWVYRDKVAGAEEYSKAPAKVIEIKGFAAANDSTFIINKYGYESVCELYEYEKKNATKVSIISDEYLNVGRSFLL